MWGLWVLQFFTFVGLRRKNERWRADVKVLYYSGSDGRKLSSQTGPSAGSGFCWALYLSVTGQGGYRTVFGPGVKLSVESSKSL